MANNQEIVTLILDTRKLKCIKVKANTYRTISEPSVPINIEKNNNVYLNGTYFIGNLKYISKVVGKVINSLIPNNSTECRAPKAMGGV